MAPTAGVPESVLKKRRRCLELFRYLMGAKACTLAIHLHGL